MTVEIGFRARLDQLAAELRKIPNLTEKEVRAAVKGAEVQWRRMPAAAKKAAQQSAASMRQVTASISSISPAAGMATSAVQSLGVALGPGMAAALGPIGLAAAAVAALAGASFMAANRMSSLVDEVANLAEGTGQSQRMVIALRHAVSAAGGDIGKTTQALSSFNKVMADDLAGKSGPEVARVLTQTIARIEAIADPADRAAERMRIFGTRSSIALAGLTSGGLDEAARKTSTLADRMERAAGSSGAMDESATNLNRAVTELTVVLGDKVAPSVVRVTDLLAGLADATTAVTDSVVGQTIGWISWYGSGGPIWDSAAYAIGKVSEATENHEGTLAKLNRAIIKTKTEYREFSDVLADIEHTYGQADFILAPAVEPGRAARAPADLAAIEAARKRAKEVADATAEVQRQARQDDIWGEAMRLEEISRMAAEGARMQADLDAEDARLADARMRRIAEEAEATRRLAEERRRATEAAIAGAASIVGAFTQSRTAIAVAQLGEALGYQAVAIARAFAEGGPFLGPGLALSVAGALAGPIAQLASIARRSPPGSGGGGGGGASPGQGRQGVGLDAASSAVVVAEYRGDIYDAQTRDAARRAGAPLRDIVRQRRIAR
jgi:hypothetical protein